MEQAARKSNRETPARSLHGCRNCRRSKVKCDEQKPSCTRCWQKDLQCLSNFQLKWESNFRDRGVAFGRSGLWSKNSPKERRSSTGSPGSVSTFPKEAIWLATPAIHPWTFVNNDLALLRRLCDEEQNNAEPHLLPAFDAKTAIGDQGPCGPMLSFSRPPSPSSRSIEMSEMLMRNLRPSLSLFPLLDELGNQVLFDYYIKQICPRTMHNPLSQSPFASVILPYCVSASPIVLRAIQALAACHWSQYDSQYSNVGLHLKLRVLSDFRKRINLDPRVLVAEDPEVLVIVMFLCLFDIVDDCNQQWIVHLQGAKDIIRLRRQQLHLLTEANESVQHDSVSSFVEIFFAFQDVMGRTACAKADLFGSSYWKEDDTTINPWMGCSPALVSILFSVMDLSRSRRFMVSDKDLEAFSVRAAALNSRLKALEQGPNADEKDQIVHRVAELKRFACVVYLNCALYGGKPSDPMIRSYVWMILKDILKLLALEATCHVIWPLFVAAVELNPLDTERWVDPETRSATDGRRLVLELLAKMAKSSVSSVSRTRVVIEQVWKSRDFSLSKFSDPKQESIPDINDWEKYIAPVSDALSLV
ncbi:fungal-specific transcription factor domain-containing protein [Aspergillus cavernicola]|uniref:Fungal-specific transcription factor domain-containing protein n=1 Tax=Aspergillus cavernicola TaxID=176166 RepID=A0ABR4HYF8_9EURO